MKKAALMTLMICALAACGVKPGEVEPPDGVKSGEFPRTYPDIMTRPPPHVPPAH